MRIAIFGFIPRPPPSPIRPPSLPPLRARVIFARHLAQGVGDVWGGDAGGEPATFLRLGAQECGIFGQRHAGSAFAFGHWPLLSSIRV